MCATPASTRRATCAPSQPRSPRPPRACPAAPSRRIFFGGGTPSLMQPATVGAILDAIGKHWTRRARRRGHARSQSDQRRGDALSRLSRGRRQPRLARRAGARRCLAEGARPAAHRAGSARCGRDRARDLRALFVRSDLCAAGPDARRLARRAQARDRAKPPSICRSISSPSSRTRRSSRCTQPASSSFPTTTLRATSTTSRRRSAARRPAGLRDFQPRAAGRRVPAQSGLLARPRICRHRARRAWPAHHRRHAATRPRPRSARKAG